MMPTALRFVTSVIAVCRSVTNPFGVNTLPLVSTQPFVSSTFEWGWGGSGWSYQERNI